MLSGVSYKKGWCDCWRNVEGGDLGKKSAGAGRGEGMGWIYFKFTISSPPPATTLPDILANRENISVESSNRFWSVAIRFLSFCPGRHPAPVSCICTYKRKISGKHRFLRPVGREPRAGETMKIVFWFNLALHGIQLGRNKAHLLMFSQLYFSFHFNPTYFK